MFNVTFSDYLYTYHIVKALQGLGMLGVSVVLWRQGFSGSMVLWFRGGRSGPSETEVERNAMDYKKRTKTRLRSNHSYYTILIVEDAQPITYKCKQR